ncbi:MAG TPA: 4'-phosphopantetheinyl transferase [Gammaproteobacteria bacterium]|jgi:4'-phosphopantetheinyl transferase EntD|nr:4'-phosphopantetheinyl transferase [Gammaproteobacteria bacterium]
MLIEPVTVPGLDAAQLQSLFDTRTAVFACPVSDLSTKLLPEEFQLVQRAVQKRRDEFSSGRFCAHQALQAIGRDEGALLSGDQREPLWPSGVVGSISHSGPCAVAAASTDPVLLSVGVDVETSGPLPDRVRDMICMPEDLAALGDNAENPVYWKLIFSAKESVYKCLFPLLQRWMGFSQARIHFDFSRAQFSVALDHELCLPAEARPELLGRFLITDTYLVTSVQALRA